MRSLGAPQYNIFDLRESIQELMIRMDEVVVQHQKLKDSYNSLLRGLSPKAIEWFAKACGAKEVHRSYRDNMLSQGRTVASERMTWETLPEQDKELDVHLSEEILIDYTTWVLGWRTGDMSVDDK